MVGVFDRISGIDLHAGLGDTSPINQTLPTGRDIMGKTIKAFTPEQRAARKARHERELARRIKRAQPQYTGRAVFTIAGASD